MNIRLPEGSASALGFNASNQSLVNILLQQAAKTKEKKRPTFEEVFAKLNARTARMDANKNPMNNMLTNEQLFRYYIKDTEPKLRVSDESFNVEDALNPMQESNPNKIYGSGAVQTSDIIPSRNPYNNAENIGFQDPLQAQAEAAAAAARALAIVQSKPNKPISGKLAALAQQYGMPAAAAAAAAPVDTSALAGIITGAPVDTSAAALDIVLGEADDNYKDALAINNRLSIANYATVSEEGQMLLKIFFSGDYIDQSTYFMKILIDGRGIENGVSGLYDLFYQVRLNKPTNNFITSRIKDIVGSTVLQDEFDRLYNPNNVSQQEFLQNIAKRINANYFFTDLEKARIDRELAAIDSTPLSNIAGEYLNNAEKAYYDLYGKSAVRNALTGDPVDPFEAFNQALVSRAVSGDQAAENDRNAEVVFEGLMDELFNDMATEMTTNTDINSTVLDPELVKKLADRAKALASRAVSGDQAAAGGGRSVPRPSPISISNPAGSAAEAGSGEVNIDNVISRRGRGVQPGDIRGPYEKTRKKEAASTLQAAIRRGLEQSAPKGDV